MPLPLPIPRLRLRPARLLRLARCLLGAALLALVATVAARAEGTAGGDLPGYDRFTVRAPHRTDLLAASVWYPAGTRTYRGLIGDNAVFTGTPALVGAGVAQGRFPLVVISHGSGGNMDGLGWLSAGLARQGFMVLAVNHPGSTSGDSSPRRSLLLDERAADLTAALDQLLADPAFASHIDTGRIAALGFSLGGSTVLNLAGAGISGDGYRAYCAGIGKQAGDCTFFVRGGVDFAALPAGFTRPGTPDGRISRFVAVEPGFSRVLTNETLAKVTKPVLLINLGGAERWMATDLSAAGSNLPARLPDARYVVVAPGHHFTFLAVCKPAGAALLAQEQDDPVCTDPPGTDRAKAHAEILAAIVSFLKS